MSAGRTGVVLFGHGARDPRWADTMVAIAGRIRAASPSLAVELAYLEFLSPDLAGAVDALRARGVDEIVVAPVFLAAGGHVLRDLPQRLADIAARHPGLTVRVEPALGSVASVVDAMARHCVEAAAAPTPVSAAGSPAPAGRKKGVDAP